MMLRFPLATLAVGICFASFRAEASDLTITIESLRNNQGQIFLCVFSAETSDKAAFPDCEKGKAIRSQKIIAGTGNTVVTFYGLKDGEYAVAMIHDENGNGKLDTSIIGIPTEGIGVSNNSRLIGSPSYDAAKFNINGNTAITITTKYLM
jgi:uncharacterized protein (DUF2141 family)